MGAEQQAWMVSFSKTYTENLQGEGRLYVFSEDVRFNVKVHSSSLSTFIATLLDKGYELLYIRPLEVHELHD
jgi:hypothetical protein